MTTFTPTWLMIKQHDVTGLKYFCKTINKDPIKYKGSGTVWRRHIKVHGTNITTLWYQLFLTKEEIHAYATKFSVENDIVNIRDENGIKLWANLINENGIDGGGNAGMVMLVQQKEKLCDKWVVTTPDGTEEHIENMLEYCRQHKLNASAMSAVARGDRRHYKKYKCKKLTNNRNVKYEPKEPRPYLTEQEKKQINSNAVSQAKRNTATPKIKYNGVVYNTLIEATENTGISRHMLIKHGELLRNN